MDRFTIALSAMLVGHACLDVPRAAAQERDGASVTGVVLDSAARPIADVDVFARPGNHRTRTDSAGHFALTGLDGGSYHVWARKVGFAPERWDVSLSDAGRLDHVKFVLAERVLLDTVRVTAARNCSTVSLDGFVCRRQSAAAGVFLDYPDIDSTGAVFTADVFRTIPGFRVRLVPTRGGPLPVPVSARASGCINALVDGREATAANLVPRYTRDVSAIEVYAHPDSVPAELRRYTLPRGYAGAGRCSLVVYWTIWAAVAR